MILMTERSYNKDVYFDKCLEENSSQVGFKPTPRALAECNDHCVSSSKHVGYPK